VTIGHPPGRRLLVCYTFRQASGYLPSRKASQPFGWYQVILLVERFVNNLPNVVTQLLPRVVLEPTTCWSQVHHCPFCTSVRYCTILIINWLISICKSIDDCKRATLAYMHMEYTYSNFMAWLAAWLTSLSSVPYIRLTYFQFWHQVCVLCGFVLNYLLTSVDVLSHCVCFFQLSATCVQIQPIINLTWSSCDTIWRIVSCFKMWEFNVEDWKLIARAVVKLNSRRADMFLSL